MRQAQFKETQLSSTKYESWKRKKVDSYEGNVKNEYNIKNSRSWKSCKTTLQKKKNYNKTQEKKQFPFTDRNNDIDLYSCGDQTDTAKVMIRSSF